ncbi:MAG: DUF3343 domain-containing protein [Eubacteriaceae bacterium]|jgi:Protein of unknown function (DUF3343).|nr:DUF3343 domain-containing protein [Eubacteriaceae bacterium]
MPEVMRHYILVDNNEQGMKLHRILDEDGVENRIAPVPQSIQGEYPCGMSVMIGDGLLDKAVASIGRHGAEYYKIVSVEVPFMPNRDRYC